jgi:hypothetical protein
VNNLMIKVTFLGALFLALTVASAIQAQAEEASTPQICAVNCVKPMEDKDSQSVIETLKLITRALADQDFKAMSFYLDPKCTTYDENTKKLVVGREAIIADIKANVASQGRSVSFTIDRPFARVDGDRATVSFVLIKETGGSSPAKFESHCSDVFVRRDGAWKKLHFFGEDWKKVM